MAIIIIMIVVLGEFMWSAFGDTVTHTNKNSVNLIVEKHRVS